MNLNLFSKWFAIICVIISTIALVMVGNVSAQSQQNLGTFKQGTTIQLRQTCANCSFVNITSIYIEETDISFINTEVAMQKNGLTFYNYSFPNTSRNGDYVYTGYGDPNGIIEVWGVRFSITPNGEEPTTAKAFFYIGLLALLVFFLVLIFWAHLQDQSHLARFWWFSFMWIPIWAILFIGWSMSRDFLTSGGAITSIFWWAFLVIGVVYPFFILGLVLYTFYYIYQQKEVQRLITRGFSLEDAQNRAGGRGRGMMN